MYKLVSEMLVKVSLHESKKNLRNCASIKPIILYT